jgi:hypothetical protein
MPEPELTATAKEAIRSYVMKLLVLPAAASTILAFFLGYFIKDVASQSAYTDAYKQASIQILGISGDAQAAKQSAIEAMRAAQQGRDDIVKAVAAAQATLSEAQTIRNSLKTLQALQQSENIVAGVAGELASREDFKKALADLAVTDLKNALARLDSIGMQLQAIERQSLKLGKVYFVQSQPFQLYLGVRSGMPAAPGTVVELTSIPERGWTFVER